ncbi:MAG TPA: arylamine N-acetyltransferase [Albitalea sp.]|uniref:arylamine N-acetyltransferase family protein n=1 Tax=Piscinibacter sp. TaxID=1903157 RepID=UPI002ED06D80
MDLDAYLQRIGWTMPVAPDRSTLEALVAHHAAAIPFENLDPLRGHPVQLAPDALQAKLVHGGRGGYCFEHNGLLAEVLVAIGFRVTRLAARVLWGRPDDAITARSHMLLKVDLPDGPSIADVGFGGMTLTGVLRLVPDEEQATPHEPFRLVAEDEGWRMQAQLDAAWKSLYRFDLQRQHPIDYEAANHYLSTHPDSHFVSGLVAARAAPDRRLALRNRELAVHPLGGVSERRVLRSAAEIRQVLEEEFLIAVPRDAALDRRLDALPG